MRSKNSSSELLACARLVFGYGDSMRTRRRSSFYLAEDTFDSVSDSRAGLAVLFVDDLGDFAEFARFRELCLPVTTGFDSIFGGRQPSSRAANYAELLDKLRAQDYSD